MRVFSYRMRFLTPAFLGDASQNGRWRTPPIKALLRQFWRMAYAADHRFHIDVAQMRHEEGMLFGHAWLKDDTHGERNVAARKSAVRIRLDDVPGKTTPVWTAGSQKGVEPLPTRDDTSHAWFGLVKRKGNLPDRTGIKATGEESERILRLAVPDAESARIERTLQLAAAFGSLGSRSRGGWGSPHLDGLPTLDDSLLDRHMRELDACLGTDWAMSLARDANGICLWQSPAAYTDWSRAMKDVALERRRVRTELREPTEVRVALGFASGGRMPCPLRWRIVASANGMLAIRVAAIPHRIPDAGKKTLSEGDLRMAWKKVCSALDESKVFRRASSLAIGGSGA